MNNEKLINNILLILSALLALANATSLIYLIQYHMFFAFVSIGIATSIALYLIKKDSSPRFGIVFFVVILANTAIQLWGGATTSAAFLYPVIFLWIKKESIKGPILTIAGILAVIEFLSPIIVASNLGSGNFSFSSILDVLVSSLIAGLVPLLSMFAIEFLAETKSTIGRKKTKPNEIQHLETSPFPDDIARSLVPLIKTGTDAHGVFLFVKNRNLAWTMNEFDVVDGNISRKYMVDYDDPLIRIMNANTSQTLNISLSHLSPEYQNTGLPWYINANPNEWISVIQFRQSNVLHGFIVIDYQTQTAQKEAAAFLVDSAFILSLTWDQNTSEPDNGFLRICQELESSKNIPTAIHKLISVIVANFKDSTATVAVLEDDETLMIFESMGPFGDGRGWKKYTLDEGIVGTAIKKKQPLRRLKMGNQRTFSISDDPEMHIKSCCVIPLIERGNTIGVLTVESSKEHHFTPESFSQFKAYATIFSLVASRNTMIELNRKLRKNDRITGLPLLSTFHLHLKEIVKEVRKKALSVAILAVNIYEFEKINQLHGYTIGDKVLKKTADKLQNIVSKRALVAKSGSDVFLICLTEVDRVTADAYAVRIHEEFASNPLKVNDIDIPISVSIGGAVSHVDRMITKLPRIAVSLTDKVSEKQGFSAITEVGPFYESDL